MEVSELLFEFLISVEQTADSVLRIDDLDIGPGNVFALRGRDGHDKGQLWSPLVSRCDQPVDVG